MKKITLLFDATPIAQNFFKKTDSRSGIYFASYNILRAMAESKQYTIILYVSQGNSYKLLRAKKRGHLLSDFPYITMPDRAFLDYTISVHKKNINETRNILLKTLYMLKIIKRFILRTRNCFFPNDSSVAVLNTVDVFFSPAYPVSEEIKQKQHIKRFIVIHDTMLLNFPEYFPAQGGFLWNVRLMDSLDKKTYYFCNSECTKQDFLKYAANQIDNEKISVIHHASSQNFTHITDAMEFDSILKKYGISPAKNRQYIFSFCTAEPRKNLVFTVECFIKFIKKHNITNLYFYFGGGHWNDFLKKIEKKINTFGNYKDKIIRLGYIDDIDVNAFYSNSLFFTYISQYEGFGVPPLEAMMAGTPVITSNNSSLPEVVGDAAITIEYNNEEQCIKAFEGLYFNKDLRTQYIAKGLERAKLFSWEKTVQCMTETITKACENETGA